MAAVSAALAQLAEKHRDTPMPGRTHLQQALPITFGYKCAIWLSMRTAMPSACASEAARAGRAVRRRGRHARLARRKGYRSPARVRARTQARRSADHLACGARRRCRDDQFPRARDRLARQDRLRHHADDDDRAWRGVRAVRRSSRRVLDHAAEAQPDFLRNPRRQRQGGAPARRPGARCHDPGLRARHRPVACRMDGCAGKLHVDGRLARAGEVHARRPRGRRGAHAQESRHDARA